MFRSPRGTFLRQFSADSVANAKQARWGHLFISREKPVGLWIGA